MGKEFKKIFTEIRDEDNPLYIFQTTNMSLLLKIVNKKLDPVLSAKKELAARGLDGKGKWIGFDQSEELWGLKKKKK